jgi:hypothetical protein
MSAGGNPEEKPKKPLKNALSYDRVGGGVRD